MNQAEALLEVHLKEQNIPYEREAKLVDGRRYRWDFAIGRLAVEIQGGIWMKKSGHNTGLAIQRDIEKARMAAACGYIPVAFVTKEVMNGTAIQWILDNKSLCKEAGV